MRINLPSVRLSFPSLFEHGTYGGESTGKYEATFILDKVEHADVIKEIKTKIANVIKEKLKGSKSSPDRICLRDGDEQERPELEGKYTIKGSTKRRPVTIDRDRTPVTDEDGIFYAGCYVNAIVTLWAQNNAWGKRVNCQLDGVQFVRDGEPFGEGGATIDDFDAFGDAEEDYIEPF